MRLSSTLTGVAHLSAVFAATAAQWRNQSIYQVVIDRFALPAGSDTSAECDPGAQTWCGGTWRSLQDNLDYIQSMGFTSVWISPVSKNYENKTAYGDAYHGYWVTDISQINERFGTAEDLKALSNAIHSRGMLLMVDIVVNNVMAVSLAPDHSQFFFKDASQYHSYCPVAFGNRTSEEQCWLGDLNVTLPDVNTEQPAVIAAYNSWIASLVQTYGIDGLRIDAAKHVRPNFWPGFCASAAVFCIGEVYTPDLEESVQYATVMDSVLNFPMYYALVQAFQIPGPQNMTTLAQNFQLSRSMFNDTLVLGNFLENQDVPRWANISVDPQSMYNAMVYTFMWDGIPIVFYGQEQRLSGAGDPWNRAALWPTKYQNTSTVQLITKLNTLRTFLASQSSWLTPASILTVTDHEIAFMKGPAITILTNIGSPVANLLRARNIECLTPKQPQNASIAVYTSFPRNVATTE